MLKRRSTLHVDRKAADIEIQLKRIGTNHNKKKEKIEIKEL
jgi:hypothetical protein